MLKGLVGLAGAGLLFLCLAAYVFQNVMFPATLAAAADQAMAGSVPGYAGQITAWMLSNGEHPPGASVLTPFDGYEGPTGFYACGPYFIDTDAVVITSRHGASHAGVDYATISPDLYPPLLAPISGKVVFADWSQVGYGNLVVIENRGVRVYLAHLSGFDVSAGQIVSAGDLLGTIGSTGNSSGAHLHFEVRIQDPENPDYGQVVDPSSVLLPGQSQPCNWAPGTGRYVWQLREAD